MTPVDGLLVFSGFLLGCRPLLEWLARRGFGVRRDPRRTMGLRRI